MTASITETQPKRRLPIADAEPRCVLCDRIHQPGEPAPIRHEFVFGVRPWITCPCDQDHYAPVWHSFVVVTQRGVVAGGLVCPVCAVDPGLGAGVEAAVIRAYTTAYGTN